MHCYLNMKGSGERISPCIHMFAMLDLSLFLVEGSGRVVKSAFLPQPPMILSKVHLLTNFLTFLIVITELFIAIIFITFTSGHVFYYY